MKSNEDKLIDLILKWEEASERGEDIPPDRLCADCPELVKPLSHKIARLKKMAWMSKVGDTGAGLSEPDPMSGQTLAGRYLIESAVGEGGFGRVYRAFDNELQRHVAVKVAITKTTGITNDLLHEARRAAKLRHSNIVSVHDVGRHEGSAFIVSDLIEGRSLAEVIETGKPSPQQAAQWIADVAEGLQVAHNQGFVHRDIKPSNILIDQHGKALITDFGISVTTDQINRGQTRNIGTLSYMAPEQLAEEMTLVGPTADIFSLGVVFFELLTGTHPFEAKTDSQRRQAILLKMPPSPSSIRQDVPDQLARICLKCLAKHPSERFESASLLAKALRTPPTSKRRLSKMWLIAIPCLLIVASPLLRRGDSKSQSKHDVTARPTVPDSHVATSVPPKISPPKADGFYFDGEHRIVTPIRRSLPTTVEAWVKPQQQQMSAYFVGSGVRDELGLSIGTINSQFVGQRVRGALITRAVVEMGEWTHLAAVFGESETRLYANGKLVESGATDLSSIGQPMVFSDGELVEAGGVSKGSAPKRDEDAPFVIGGIGIKNRMFQFVGEIRAVRMSNVERFKRDFVPDEIFEPDSKSSDSTVLIYDKRSGDGEVVKDLSGHGNDGRWETSQPTGIPSVPK